MNIADFGLKPKPFSLLPTDSSVQRWAGMPDAKRKLEDIVSSVRPDDIGTQEFVVVYGTLGGGKTHALRYFKHQIDATHDSYAFYIGKVRRRNKLSFFDMYCSIISENSEILPLLAEKVVAAVNAEIRIARESGKYPDLGDSEFRRAIIKDTVAPNDVALVEALMESSPANIDALLTNKKLVSDDYSAACMLSSLVGLMTCNIGSQQAPYKAAYLFFDEVEDVLETRYPELRMFFSALREFVNRTADYHCAIICAFTQEGAVLEAQIPSFLMDRLTRPFLEMRDLSPEEAKGFVKDYLPSVLTSKVVPTSAFFPFTEETIEFFLDMEQPVVPRKLLRAMGQVFERAMRREKINPGEEITPEMAKDILVEMGSMPT